MESDQRDWETRETIPQLVMNNGMTMIVEEISDLVSEEMLSLKTKILQEQTNSGLVPVSAIKRIFEGE